MASSRRALYVFGPMVLCILAIALFRAWLRDDSASEDRSDQLGRGGLTQIIRAGSSWFRIQPGFTIDLVAEHDLTGSVVNLSFDTQGRPVVARERGPVLILEDGDGDGRYETAKPYTDQVQNCQGILAYDAATYYLVGDGPAGTGLYRLTDTDGDDEADQVDLVHHFRGGEAEHGAHAVLVGPDGYLYLMIGNHAWVSSPREPNSPLERQYEADVLPRYEDPYGHAAGITVPGGTIWRLDQDGNELSLEVGGLRNAFDFAFHSVGELLTCDSDMEGDEFLPWYRPVRICHCPPGAEFGWRSGTNKWPAYYLDSLPPIREIGRGSPSGVVFYHHHQFPTRYSGALFIADWSHGRIFAVHLKRNGATFSSELEEFVTGQPLNATDIEVAPDGSLFFATGGRGSQGGVYRIRWGAESAANDMQITPSLHGAAAARAALKQPQPESAWGRAAIRQFKAQAGDMWGPVVAEAVFDSQLPAAQRIRAVTYLMQFGPEPSLQIARQLATDPDPEIRAQAPVLLGRQRDPEADAELVRLLGDSTPIVQRRALEGLIRTPGAAPLEKLFPLLASHDRFVRYGARLVLEQIEPPQWLGRVLDHQDPRVAIVGLIALNQLGTTAADEKVAKAAWEKILSLLRSKLTPDDQLDTLRCLELTLVNAKFQPPTQSIEEIGRLLHDRFPTRSMALDRELSRVLAAMQVPGTIEKLLKALESTDSLTLPGRTEAIHRARCLVAVTDGWTFPQRTRYLAWFDKCASWRGGQSYQAYLANFLREAIAQLSAAEQEAVLLDPAKFPRAVSYLVAQAVGGSGPMAQAGELSTSGNQTYDWTYQQLLRFLEDEGRTGSVAAGRKVFEKATCARCHRLGTVGTGPGPDLTKLSSRFQRRDILEATVYPSRIIPDQYKSVLVTTQDGHTITAMKALGEGDNLVLLLSDATTLRVPISDVEEIVEAKQSIMPGDLLNQLSLQEIADLFAFLESGS